MPTVNALAFSALPASCGYYQPHSTECLDTLWMQAGCLSGGTGFPSNLTVLARSAMSEVTIE